jgi:uncharacterized membrane protein
MGDRMTEGVFILTALFVAYVIYVIVNEKKAGGESTKPAPAAMKALQQTVVAEKPKAIAKPAAAKKAPAKAAAKPVPAQLAAVQEAVVAKPVAVVEKTAAAKPVAAAQKPAVAKPAAAQKPKVAEASAPEATAVKGAGLKDPKTGEVATAYGNYRFTKRWIKEALVSEKLVDKVYKNDELNASVEAKIKAGIVKLEGMKKYQP